MPRKKPAEIEILPPEDDQQSRGRKRLVEAEHTIKYSAPVPVTVEEDEVEESDLLLDGDPVDIEKKRKRKTAKTERDELRKKLMNHGVTAASTLKLIIERYVHSDGPDSGTTAEKSHCTKYGCDESHVLNQDYMDVAAKWGAGRYWFTLYKDGTIVSQWEKRLEPSRPIVQHINPNDPTSPQVIVQTTNGDSQQSPYQPMSMKDMMKAQRESLKEELEFRRLLMESYGMAPGQPQQETRSEEEIIAGAIIKQPAVIESVVESIIKRVGVKGGDSDEPWWAGVLKDSITTGQLAPTVQGIVKALFPNGLFGGLSNLLPGGQNNGQAPMAETQFPQGQQTGDQVQNSQTRQEALVDIQQGHEARALSDTQPKISNQAGNQQTSPEEQALQLLIEHCRRNIPAEIACDRLISFADAVNDQAPHLSIDRYISIFATMPVEAAIEFVKTQLNGEQVASLPHAQQWTSELQRLIKEAGQEGDEE